jgi:hypothetical protein
VPFCGRIARHEAEASVLKLHESIVGTKDHSGEILVNKDLALGALRVPFIKNYQRSCRCVALVIGFERYLHVYAEKKRRRGGRLREARRLATKRARCCTFV